MVKILSEKELQRVYDIVLGETKRYWANHGADFNRSCEDGLEAQGFVWVEFWVSEDGGLNSRPFNDFEVDVPKGHLCFYRNEEVAAGDCTLTEWVGDYAKHTFDYGELVTFTEFCDWYYSIMKGRKSHEN